MKRRMTHEQQRRAPPRHDAKARERNPNELHTASSDGVAVMSDKEENQIQTAVRLPESWLERIDKIAESMSKPGVPATRAGALRSALHRGRVELEKENKRR